MFRPACPSEIIHPLNVPAKRTRGETFPGATCLTRFLVLRVPRQITEVSVARSKAAPSKRFAPQIAGLPFRRHAYWVFRFRGGFTGLEFTDHRPRR
jgi:hypothetical protein